MTLNLFSKILIGGMFHFGDKPDRILIKSDKTHYVAPEGRRVIHPHVAVIEHVVTTSLGGESIYDKFLKGKSNE